MQTTTDAAADDPLGGVARYAFRLTPAEWRAVLADDGFLRHPDNNCRPRRLMGVPVEIVPDHSFA